MIHLTNHSSVLKKLTNHSSVKVNQSYFSSDDANYVLDVCDFSRQEGLIKTVIKIPHSSQSEKSVHSSDQSQFSEHPALAASNSLDSSSSSRASERLLPEIPNNVINNSTLDAVLAAADSGRKILNSF